MTYIEFFQSHPRAADINIKYCVILASPTPHLGWLSRYTNEFVPNMSAEHRTRFYQFLTGHVQYNVIALQVRIYNQYK